MNIIPFDPSQSAPNSSTNPQAQRQLQTATTPPSSGTFWESLGQLSVLLAGLWASALTLQSIAGFVSSPQPPPALAAHDPISTSPAHPSHIPLHNAYTNNRVDFLSPRSTITPAATTNQAPGSLKESPAVTPG